MLYLVTLSARITAGPAVAVRTYDLKAVFLDQLSSPLLPDHKALARLAIFRCAPSLCR